MTFEPPRYAWTADTAYDALAVLQAATDLIESYTATLAPDSRERYDAKRNSTAKLSVDLDLSALVEQINGAAAATQARMGSQPFHFLPSDSLGAAVGRQEARGMLLDLLQGFAEQGRLKVTFRDFAPHLGKLSRTRSWVVRELQNLVASGVISQETLGEYHLDRASLMNHQLSPS
ncbi:hypothetical protein ADK70_12520 [Streptomyces rimosus subsp. pseudoverticillatus]|uniref:hypothetical protein n=1 Tax=Streptomyces rimosus TaxID=1927 RepID=UPI0006B2631F|nr:hypothetical protein [Streptomyces rimosus]KOT94497.1 hypothetical protein ADK70_12520 [Streptomyces rimosus subsp. pseudoverticillatus]